MVEKAEWSWDVTTKTFINPLSKELDGLEAMDNDYDFSVVMDVCECNDNTTVDKEEEGVKDKMSAVELALSKMNLVLAGQDADSVSTLGNPMSPDRLYSTNKSTLIAASSGASVRSAFTLDSRVSAMEEQMNSMEVNLKKGFDESLNSFFQKFQAAQAPQKPPGGELAGGNND